MPTHLPHPSFNTTTRTPRRACFRTALGVLGTVVFGCGPQASASPAIDTKPMTLKLQLGARTLRLHLDDNPTARDLLALLPLTLRLEDYAATEKIATLPRRLSTSGAPAGYTPAAGDLAYYAPWGNLAFFHKPFAYSAGLIRLGRLENGIEQLAAPGNRVAELRRSAD